MNSSETPNNSSEQLSLYELHKKLDKINEDIAFSEGDAEQQLLAQKADLEKQINASPEKQIIERENWRHIDDTSFSDEQHAFINKFNELAPKELLTITSNQMHPHHPGGYFDRVDAISTHTVDGDLEAVNRMRTLLNTPGVNFKTKDLFIDLKTEFERLFPSKSNEAGPMSRRDTAIKHISEQMEQARKNLEEFGSQSLDHDDEHLYELQDYVERLEYEFEEIMKDNEQIISLYSK